MFDTVSNEGTGTADKLPKAAPKQMSVALQKLINEAHEIGYRKGYSAGHKDGFDRACAARAK